MSASTNQDQNRGYLNIVAPISNRISCCNWKNVSDNSYPPNVIEEPPERSLSQLSTELPITEEILEYQE